MKIKNGRLRGKDKWANIIEYILNMKHQSLKGTVVWVCSCGHRTKVFIESTGVMLEEDLLECKKCKLSDSIIVK